MADTRTLSEHEELQLVTFNLAQEEFAIDILQVQEINRILDITAIPRSPDWVRGVVNLRGRIVPVVDLRRHFALPPADETADSRIVVVDVMDRTLGLMVDRVNEVLRVAATTVEPPPQMVSGVDRRFIQGVGKRDERLFLLLDLDLLVGQDMLETLHEVQTAGQPEALQAATV